MVSTRAAKHAHTSSDTDEDPHVQQGGSPSKKQKTSTQSQITSHSAASDTEPLTPPPSSPLQPASPFRSDGADMAPLAVVSEDDARRDLSATHVAQSSERVLTVGPQSDANASVSLEGEVTTTSVPSPHAQAAAAEPATHAFTAPLSECQIVTTDAEQPAERSAQEVATLSATETSAVVIVNANEGNVRPAKIALEPITETTREYFTQPLIARMNKMLHFTDTTSHIYGLHVLPAESLGWGTIRRGNGRNTEYLCIGSVTVTVWVIAEVTFWRYLRVNGQKVVEGNHRRPSLGLHIFSNGEFEKLKSVMFDNSPVKQCWDVVDDDRIVYAKKWMAPASVPADKIKYFSQIYDGSLSWSGPDESKLIHPGRLQVNDTVMVEMAFRREFERIPPPAGSPPGTKGTTNYNTWTPELELVRVVVLQSAPKMGAEAKVASSAYNF